MKKFLLIFSIILLTYFNAYAGEPMKTEKATFAGGCFWCIQPAFDNLEGVNKTTVGYSGGDANDANYEAVSSHKTKHLEAIQIEYDPSKVTFRKLLERFMRNIDPTDNEGQFADKGPQYRTAIFYHDDEQKKIAEEYFAELKTTGQFKYPIYTEITPYKNFYSAEEYHQKYYQKNAVHYNMYKYGSGRPAKLEKIWGEEGGEKKDH
jgi:methionine-S-sulfoxide reductase